MNKQSPPIIFGEVLYDCFPDGNRVLGGAPFNVAWHCHAFGLEPQFVSSVGNDSLGEGILQAMRDWGMDTGAVQIDDQHATGIVDVKFNNGEPSYDIVEDSAWDFITEGTLPEFDKNSMLYHGSLALRSETSASALSHIKQGLSSTVIVDINLRAPWWKLEKIEHIIDGANWLKLNEEELGLIAGNHGSIEETIQHLCDTRSLDLVIVTRGEEGVVVCDANGNVNSVAPTPAKQVVDTVGAGDSFSSVVLLGKYQQWPMHTTLERAQQFASAIVGIQGATINDQAFYQSFIDQWQLNP